MSEKIELPEEIRLSDAEFHSICLIFEKEFLPHIKAAVRRLKSMETRPRVRKKPWPALKKFNVVADAILLGEQAFCDALRLAPEPVVRGFDIAYIPLKTVHNSRDELFFAEQPEGEKRRRLLKLLRIFLSLNDDASPAFEPLEAQWPPVFVHVRSHGEIGLLRVRHARLLPPFS